jgi:calcium/proton exchanger cax
MGAKNKPDLAIGIAMGSSIQIALFIAPVLVFASYFIAPVPLELSFGRAEWARCSLRSSSARSSAARVSRTGSRACN